MKTQIKTQILGIITILTILIASSCKKEKDKQIPPNINFKTSSGYTFDSGIFPMNDTLLVGINAEKTEDKDLLTRFVETQKYDAGSATTLLNESFNQDTYSKDMTIITRSVSGTEVYTFTIINRDGLTTTKTLTITIP